MESAILSEKKILIFFSIVFNFKQQSAVIEVMKMQYSNFFYRIFCPYQINPTLKRKIDDCNQISSFLFLCHSIQGEIYSKYFHSTKKCLHKGKKFLQMSVAYRCNQLHVWSLKKLKNIHIFFHCCSHKIALFEVYHTCQQLRFSCS